MKKFLGLGLLVIALACPVLADELKLNIGIESGSMPTQIVGANVYALVDGKLVEVVVMPDDVAFKTNNKFGALRLKSFWATKKKMVETPIVEGK